MFKKVVSIILSVLMLASLATGITAFAATDDEAQTTTEMPTVTGDVFMWQEKSNYFPTDLVTLTRGDVISLVITIAPNKAVYSCEWTFSYNPEQVQLIDTQNFMPQITKGVSYHTSQAGVVSCAFSDKELCRISSDKPFIVLPFTVVGAGYLSSTLEVTNLVYADRDRETGLVDVSTVKTDVLDGIVASDALDVKATAEFTDAVIETTTEPPTTETVITKNDIYNDILDYRGGFFGEGSIYSDQNYEDYYNCYNKVQEVYDDPNATQQEINDAYYNFMDVVNNMELIGGNAAPYLKGDVDDDGEVTIVDAATVQLALADGKSHDYVFCNHGDVNNDRELTIMDAALIQLYKAQLLDKNEICVAGEYETRYYYACEI